MAKNYNWRIKRNYYNLIEKGIKTLEVRVGYPGIKRVKKGDTITFNDYSTIKYTVVRVTRYQDFPEMLDSEDSSKAIPGVTKYKVGLFEHIIKKYEWKLTQTMSRGFYNNVSCEYVYNGILLTE